MTRPDDEHEHLIAARARMVRRDLVARGIADPCVLEAMGAVPREAFVPTRQRRHAYEDRALGIEDDQTISQPYVVALMAEAARLRPSDRVLEVGTGSGYGAAVLAWCSAHVDTVERIDDLAARARQRLVAAGVDGVDVHVGDGTLGWPDGAPYDAIVVTAGGPDVPTALVDQLAVGGRLVGPFGSRLGQRLRRVVRRDAGATDTDDLGAVAFVPLIGEQGWRG